MAWSRNESRTGLLRAPGRGLAFGLIVGMLEVHAAFVSTGQFSWPAAIAVLVYDMALGCGIGALLGAARFASRRGRGRGHLPDASNQLPVFLALLLAVRCLADGIWVVWSPALEQSRSLLAQAVAICIGGGAICWAGSSWIARRGPGSTTATLPAFAASVAAMLYGGLLWRSLGVGQVGRSAFVLYVAWSAFCALSGLAIGSLLRRRFAWAAIALVLLLPLAGRIVVGAPEPFRVRTTARADSMPRLPQGAPLPNLILIVLDTCRADHLELYGYAHRTSPNLTRFAARSTTFTGCIANSSWTLPAHATLFTGLHSRDHGAHGGPAESDRPGPRGGRPLLSEHVTLAETLRENGYVTEAVVSNWIHVSAAYGLDQGFDYWDGRPGLRGALNDGYFPLLLRIRSLVDALPIRWIYRPLDRFDIAQKPYRRAETITEEAIARLEARPRDAQRPLFLFVNYMDPHDPYLAPGAFADRFPGRLRDRPRIVRTLGGDALAGDALRAHLVSQYDSEIAYMDHHLGILLDYLGRVDLLDDSLVVITSDHGEAFFEHGALGHGRTLYSEELRVPLIVHDPADREPGRIDDADTDLRSLMPWILSRLGVPGPPASPADGFDQGESSAEFAELYGGLASPPRTSPGERCDRVYLRTERFESILCSNGRLEIYDRAEDPEQLRDLTLESPDLRRRFEERFEAWISAGAVREPGEPAEELSPRQIERLRALGYVD